MCNLWASDCYVAGEKYGCSGISLVDNSENSIFVSLLGKSCDEIHGNVLEGFGSRDCRDSEKLDFGLVYKDFILLTDGTSFNVVCDPLGHMGP